MNNNLPQTPEAVMQLLDQVKDPEIPVLSLVELEVIREVQVSGTSVLVKMTPTYSGCPALEVMRSEMTECLTSAGFEEVKIETVYAPAWSSQWLGKEARRKLKEYGIAPPTAVKPSLVKIGAKNKAQCPGCDSFKTELRSEYGSTSCKSLHYCLECNQPFEEFKTI